MSSLFESKRSTAKAYVSNGSLPRYVDPQQPPSKKKPYSVIMNQPFTHNLQLVLPEEFYHLVWTELEAKITSVQYSRALMPLAALLEGDFFNVYIKTGNILMLSEGRPGTDDRFSLMNGELRLNLAKDKYERSGLVGKPVYDGGRKHTKTRYEVEINLRLPSMQHGKKGFERIVWAFKNVLNHSLTWLFYDHEQRTETTMERPIAKYHPTTHLCSPHLREIKKVIKPKLESSHALATDDDFEEWSLETYEWLSLLDLKSPRVLREDSIDPFLSRYKVHTGDSQTDLNLVAVSWTGLLPSEWIRALFVEICAKNLNNQVEMLHDSFFCLSGYAHQTEVADQQDGYTILCHDYRNGIKQRSVNSAEVEKVESFCRYRDYVLWQLTCR